MASNSSDKGIAGQIISAFLGLVVIGFVLAWFTSGANNADSLADGVEIFINSALDLGSRIFSIFSERMPRG